MEVTKEKLDDLMQGVKQVAIQNRERVGFSGQFTPVAIVVGPNGEHTVQATLFKSAEEKRILMKALSQTARQMNVLAIVLVNDTYHVKREKFSERFGIPDDLSWEEWQEKYSEILDTQFEGRLANAPKDLISDALCVAMKGPMIESSVFFLPYHEGVGDSIRWDKEELEMKTEILMLEDWWDTTPVN